MILSCELPQPANSLLDVKPARNVTWQTCTLLESWRCYQTARKDVRRRRLDPRLALPCWLPIWRVSFSRRPDPRAFAYQFTHPRKQELLCYDLALISGSQTPALGLSLRTDRSCLHGYPANKTPDQWERDKLADLLEEGECQGLQFFKTSIDIQKPDVRWDEWSNGTF